MNELLRKLFWAVSGGPPRLVLGRKQNSFTLSGFKGKKAVNVINQLKKWPGLEPLAGLPSLGLHVLKVPVSRLCDTRLVLQQANGLPIQIEIASNILNLQPVAAPSQFAISYLWTPEGLVRQFNMLVDYCEDGWFVSDQRFWQLSITPKENEWLSQVKITGEKALIFIRDVLPELRKKLPIQCNSTYSQEPAVQVSIQTITNEAASLHISWSSPPDEIQTAQTLLEHVIIGNMLRPGIAPASLELWGKEQEGDVHLQGEAVPSFIREILPRIRRWTTGSIDELFHQHSILDATGALVLNIQREESEGIGVVVARPEFVCGELRVNAEQISYRLSEAKNFLRIGHSWVTTAAIKSSGIGPFGRTTNGALLGPITLRAAEILARSSPRLSGPWKQCAFPQIQLPQPAGDFGAHLAFLFQWGIAGGIAGNIETIHAALHDYLAKWKTIYPSARILVVGGRKTLDALQNKWSDLQPAYFYSLKNDPELKENFGRIVFATPKALKDLPKLQSAQWSALLLLEADILIKTANSDLFQQICACTASLIAGSFTSTAFLEKNSHRSALTQAFKLTSRDEGNIIWRYGLLDSTRGVQNSSAALPSPPPPPKTAMTEYIIGTDAGKGVSVPPRPATQAIRSNDLSQSGFQIHVSFATGDERFVEMARTLANHQVTTAQFVPFESYRPTYNEMSVAQKQWYFYWRGQVRIGQYPETSLSYIFVYAYELINGIGVLNGENGYQELRALWLHYREQHAKLDSYLPDWLCDFILLNPCSIDPMQPYLDLLAFGEYPMKPDIVLSRYFAKDTGPPPLALLACYSNYSLHQSKFYTETTRPIMEEKLPQAFMYVNQAGLGQEKKNILETYRPRNAETVSRSPFQGAVYAGPRKDIVLGSVYPYQWHDPFRAFMTSFFRYSENKLRQALQHKFLLRGIELRPEVQAALDKFFTQHPVSLTQPRRIEIDLARVQALQAESDQVRDMLLQGAETKEQQILSTILSQPPLQKRIPRPPGTPDHLLTDLDEVFNVLTHLNQRELQLVQAMMQSNWEADDTQLKNTCSDLLLENAIERINQLSLQYIGDLLIANEAGQRIVAEDFRDELEHLLTHYKTELHPSCKVDNEDDGKDNSDGLPPEWAELNSRLAAAQRRALAAISSRQNTLDTLAIIARECGSMPEMLVEGINEIAMEIIGDIIIDSAADPPAVEEEDREFVEKILALE